MELSVKTLLSFSLFKTFQLKAIKLLNSIIYSRLYWFFETECKSAKSILNILYFNLDVKTENLAITYMYMKQRISRNELETLSETLLYTYMHNTYLST